MIVEKTAFPVPVKRIYISGPITGAEDWRAVFSAAEAALRERYGSGQWLFNPDDHTLRPAVDIVNPLVISRSVEGICGRDGRTPDYSDYMRADIKALSECNTICLLPGWRLSRGARLEYRIARILEMAVLEYAPDL